MSESPPASPDPHGDPIEELLGHAFEDRASGEREPEEALELAFLDRPSGEREPEEALELDSPRYQVFGEIARGGMGRILRGRDRDVGREVALKVLHESRARTPGILRRFVEEGQIAGQLQHPGIVPVYELGLSPKNKPFIAMKLVKGRTLAELLKERTRPSQDLRRFLTIFEQVCQTMAYAHSRGVIHRDLKPSNVMVGRFGEVQVMDWGLAKVLGREEARDDQSEEERVITVRSEGETASSAGSVLGTPAYMSPEQARGRIQDLDRRTDVFTLGALLCEILTGAPPYVASTSNRVKHMASTGQLAEALQRLQGSGADRALMGIAIRCLNTDKGRRPKDAGQLASLISKYLAKAEDRVRAAEVAAEKAKLQAESERKARKLTLALAVSVLLTVSLLGGGWIWVEGDRLQRVQGTERRIQANLNDAMDFRRQAEVEGGSSPNRWDDAVSAASTANELAEDEHVDADLRERVANVLENLRAAQRHARNAATRAEFDRIMQGKLVRIRIPDHAFSGWGPEEFHRLEESYGTNFKWYSGVEIDSMDVEEAASRLFGDIATELAIALDHWSWVRWQLEESISGARHLVSIARRLDPSDPFRNRLRELCLQQDPDRDALTRLLTEADVRELSPASVQLLAQALLRIGDPEGAIEVFKAGQRYHSRDFYLNYTLAQLLQQADPPRFPEAARHYALAYAAVDQHPGLAALLAYTLHEAGELEESMVWNQLALELGGNDAAAHNNLGVTFAANEEWDLAISEYEKAVALDASYAEAYANWGLALFEKQAWGAAIAKCQTAIELKPDHPEAYNTIGLAFDRLGLSQRARQAHEKALEVDPKYEDARDNIKVLDADVLFDQRRWEEARAAYEEVAQSRPEDPASLNRLGQCLLNLDRDTEAIAVFEKGARLKTRFSFASFAYWFDAVADSGDSEGAQEVFEQAIEAAGTSARWLNNLGVFLRNVGRYDEAELALRASIAVDEEYFYAYRNMGTVQARRGDNQGAIDWYRKTVELSSRYALAYEDWGDRLRDMGRTDEAVDKYLESLDCAETGVRLNALGVRLRDLGNLDEAHRAFERAIEVARDYHFPYRNMGSVYAAKGEFEKAIEWYQRAIEKQRRYELAHHDWGEAAASLGRVDEAILRFSEAIEIQPGNYDRYRHLVDLLKKQENTAGSIEVLRRATQDVDNSEDLCEIGNGLLSLGQPQDARKAYERSIALDSGLLRAYGGVGMSLYEEERYRETADYFADQFDAEPALEMEWNGWQGAYRQTAARAAVLAASGPTAHELSDVERIAYRDRAHDWLQRNLQVQVGIAGSGWEALTTTMLAQWEADADFASVRDREALSQLSDEEAQKWVRFWTEVSLLQEAASAYNSRQWSSASDKYGSLTKSWPEIGWFWYRLGRALRAQERSEDALAAFQAAVPLPGPHDAHARLDVLRILLAMGKREEAISGYEDAIPFFEEKGDPYGAARAHALMGDNNRALEALEIAAENGVDGAEYLKEGPDFETLRDDPRYPDVLSLFNGS